MTDCDAIRLELAGYVLGGLEPDEVTIVETHLTRCTACRTELDDLAPLPPLIALAAPGSPPAPDDLRPRVLRTAGRRRQIPALVAAALILLAGLAGGLIATLSVGAPDADVVVALGPADAPGVSGDAGLIQTDAGVQLDLALDGVRPATDGYYHAWMERDGRRVSAGTFVGTADGQVRARLLCGGRLEDYDRVTITWHGFDRDDEVVAAQAPLAS